MIDLASAVLGFWKFVEFHRLMTDIETERAHQSICQLVEGFDRTSMRATHTREKVSLPGLEGREAMCHFVKLGLLLFWTSKIIQNFVHSFLDSQFIVASFG